MAERTSSGDYRTALGYYIPTLAHHLFRNILRLKMRNIAKKEGGSFIFIVHRNVIGWLPEAVNDGWATVFYSPEPVPIMISTSKGALVYKRRDGILNYDSTNSKDYTGFVATKNSPIDPNDPKFYVGKFFVPYGFLLTDISKMMDEEREKRIRSRSSWHKSIDKILQSFWKKPVEKDLEGKTLSERICKLLGEENKVNSTDQFLEIAKTYKIKGFENYYSLQ